MRKDVIFALIIILVLGSLVLYSVYSGPDFLNKREYVEKITSEKWEDPFFMYSETVYPAFAQVVDKTYFGENESVKIGIAGQTNELNFGRIPLGAGTRKIINVMNNEVKPVLVTVDVIGELKPFTKADKTKILLSNGKKELIISCMPENTGNYSGEIKVRTVYPKNGLSEFMLKTM